MAEFHYLDPYPLAKAQTPWRRVADGLVAVASCEGQEVLKVAPEALTLVAREAFRDVSFLYRPAHLAQLAAILDDPESSENDRGVALALLRNAEVASGLVLPMCQDTGTATIVGKKGHRVFTDGRDEEHLSRGVFETYARESLRYSQTVPLTMYDEANSGTNLPAQVDLYATEGMEYHFLMIAKGGGSANKTALFQET
ncbi:MAG TPA: fumarate hydratase, partial [Vicinamibacteria bacterium]